MDINYFKEIFKILPLPCIIVEPGNGEFLITSANNLFLEKAKVKINKLLDVSLFEFFPDNPDLPGIEASKILLGSFQKVLETGKPDKLFRFRYDSKSSETGEFVEKYWNVENSPIRNERGEIKYILETIEDVTAQVFLEKKELILKEELASKKLQYQNFVHKNTDGLFSLDLDGNFTSANEGFEKMAEIGSDDLLSMNYLPFCPPNEKDKIINNFELAKAGNPTKFEAGFVSKTGKFLVMSVNLLPVLMDGEVIGIHGIIKDFTDIRNTERIVVEKKKFLEVNASFISSLLQNNLADDTLRDAFQNIGNAVGADRMYYFETHTLAGEEGMFISQKVEWTSARAMPQIDNPGMQNLPTSHLEEIMGPLIQNIPFTAVLKDLPESELKSIFNEQEIKSMLLLPIYFQENLHGFIGFDDCTTERIWNQDEISFLTSIAQNLTNAFERKAAEEAVEQRDREILLSEKKFRALVQEGSDLVSIVDVAGNYKFLSETTYSILGISSDSLLGKNAFDYMHLEDKDRVMRAFLKLKKVKQVKVPAFRLVDAEGKWRWLETTATNLLDEPAVKGIVVNSKEVTTQVEQAKEIEEINKRYHFAAMATEDLIYDWDLVTDEVRRFHSGLNDVFGHSLEEVDKRNFWRENIHPEEVDYLSKKLQAALKDPQENFLKTEYRFRRADGTYAHLIDRGYIIRDKKGKAIRHVGASTDISELKAKENELEIVNERFKLAMRATNEMIWDWDVTNNKIVRSDTFKEVYGSKTEKDAPPHELWFSKTHPEDQKNVETSLKAALKNENQKLWKEEYRIFDENGELIHVVDRAYIIRNEAGKVVRMVGAVLNVSKSRNLIEEIQQQNKILKEIAWEQSHVVRAPLVRLKGLLQLLDLGPIEEMSTNEIMKNLHSSADELDAIIRRIVYKTEKMDIAHKRNQS